MASNTPTYMIVALDLRSGMCANVLIINFSILTNMTILSLKQIPPISNRFGKHNIS